MKVRDVLKRLTDDGWYLDRTKGDHRVFKRESQPGTVVVSGHPSKDIPIGTLRHIYEQAGWEDKP